MNITIKINTDNAAFEDNPAGEVARIIKKYAEDMGYDYYAMKPGKTVLLDYNGNAVGTVTVKE